MERRRRPTFPRTRLRISLLGKARLLLLLLLPLTRAHPTQAPWTFSLGAYQGTCGRRVLTLGKYGELTCTFTPLCACKENWVIYIFLSFNYTWPQPFELIKVLTLEKGEEFTRILFPLLRVCKRKLPSMSFLRSFPLLTCYFLITFIPFPSVSLHTHRGVRILSTISFAFLLSFLLCSWMEEK